MTEQLMIAFDKEPIYMQGNMANRHGLIAGATGTGKTVTLKLMAEQFSKASVPVFLADIKGDLASTIMPGVTNKHIERSRTDMNLTDFEFQTFPTEFWDVFGEKGIPVRATISELGPLFLSRLMGLNETQEGIMNIVFKIADKEKMLLIDLKDLRAMLTYVGEHAKEFTLEYGNISKQSIGAIQRNLVTLEEQGGEYFFGEPSMQIHDFMKTDTEGRGVINVLAAEKLIHQPALYSTFMLWLLSELFEELPEVGDLDKPKMVFFFDEAHLLFDDAPKSLKDKIEQVVRLIRSKGVGVYFITQNPIDIPDSVLGQLGNRVQHALRAFTPRDQKAVKSAAETFRQNPEVDVAKEITELAVGEALVSFLDEEGTPSIVRRARILPPESLIGAVDESLRQEAIQKSSFYSKYKDSFDRESAFEILARKVEQEKVSEEKAKKAEEKEKVTKATTKKTASRSSGTKKKSALEKNLTSFVNSVGRTVGREIVRGIFGSLKKK